MSGFNPIWHEGEGGRVGDWPPISYTQIKIF